MFVLKNKDAIFPPLYEHVERKSPTVTDKGWDKVGNFILRDKIDFMPQAGLQENFCKCESNLIFLAGAASMGKTYSMMQKMLYGIDKVGFSGRFISVRLADSKKGTSLFRDAMELWGNYAGCEVTTGDSPTFAWPQWNSSIQMIHSNFNINNPGEWNDFKEHAKKNQASIIEVDEGTDMPFKMFAYWFSRNRDASGVSPTMVMSFNPEYGHWTTEFLILAGYIDPETYYIKPEMNGKQRFFYMMGDDVNEIIFGDSREEIVARAGIHITEKDAAAGLKEADMVKSFSLFTGEAADNLKLVSATGGGSIANLHAVGRTQRSVLKGAYFGPLDNESANVTRQMILDMTSNPQDQDETMYGTMDVSGGNTDSDDNPFIAWRGHTMVGIEFFRGDPKELVDWIDGMLQKYGIPKKNFAFDATGLGNYLKAYTQGWPVTANKTAMQEYDENGNQVVFEQYFNLRSQLMSKLEVAFKTGKISTTLDLNMWIPYGKNGETRRLLDVLFDEKETFRTLQKNKRIYYRSKDEYRAKFHASPNIIDTMYLRMIWDLDARPRKQESPDIDEDAYDGMFSNFEEATDFSQFWEQ